MTKLSELDHNMNFHGTVENFAEKFLIIKDGHTKKKRIFYVIEDDKELSAKDVKMKFEKGDFVFVSDGVLKNDTPEQIQGEGEEAEKEE